ncbi:hypothetical protein C6Y40_24040 [Alteromonas alba]|uniref:Uncharacterized protein n=1 Tax=Alteromonas alba TaxID=2079529 RepID=A0A2S9V3L5_9ALTE|nr:hypothetical protein C6Y40_24040 [Alteromonas alba]
MQQINILAANSRRIYTPAQLCKRFHKITINSEKVQLFTANRLLISHNFQNYWLFKRFRY